MEVGFCFFVKWVLHSLRGIVVQGKKKKKYMVTGRGWRISWERKPLRLTDSTEITPS